MARERLSMRKIKEILRLKLVCRLSDRQIARSCNLSRPAVAAYVRKAEEMCLVNWEEIEPLSEDELDKRLRVYPLIAPVNKKPMPDYVKVDEELRANKHVTRMLLWQEYKEQNPDGYQYTQFTLHYRDYKKSLDVVMRQEHKAGEKVFVDFCDGLEIIDGETGEVRETQLFLSVWGASNYTYAEAALGQDLKSWTGAHVRAFEYFGCVPEIVVPDNLRSGVTHACRYEPDLNPTYAEMAAHYGVAVIPARRYHPRDKAKVEVGVLIAQRWILAVLRHRRFYSLAEMNRAIWELLEKLNFRPMRKIKKCRREMFEQIDRPRARNLPERRWEYAEWIKARVNIDYHVEVDVHYYSVPFTLRGKKLDGRLTEKILELFYKGVRVASHERSYVKHGYTTVKEHMPAQHQLYCEWRPSRIIEWAAKTGAATAKVVEEILQSREHPEQGYRAAMGILRLGRLYGADRLENGCKRAIAYRTFSYKSIRSILASGLDRAKEIAQSSQPQLPWHENIRGSDYFLH